MRFDVRIEQWPLHAPVAIAGYVFEELSLLAAGVKDGQTFDSGAARHEGDI